MAENTMNNIPLQDHLRVLMDEVSAKLREVAESQKDTDRRMKETDRQMKQLSQETDKKFQETAEQIKETDRQMKDTNKRFGDLSNRFGELAEHLVVPGIKEKFNALGFNFTDSTENTRIGGTSRNYAAEVDILLESLDTVMAVEVKSKPTEEDVAKHISRMDVLRRRAEDRKAVIAGLKNIYLAPSADLAFLALNEFAAVWDKKYPMISKSWRNRWNEVIPFFKFSPEIRKAVYTTNAIESVNYTIQKIIKHRQSFPNGDAAMKLIFMGLKNISKKWTMPIRDWGAALNQFAVIYGADRVPL